MPLESAKIVKSLLNNNSFENYFAITITTLSLGLAAIKDTEPLLSGEDFVNCHDTLIYN